jgi:hypothetical protein
MECDSDDSDEEALFEALILDRIAFMGRLLAPRPPVIVMRDAQRHRTIDSFGDSDIKIHFRVATKDKLRAVMVAWVVPAHFILGNRAVVTGEEAMLMFLARFTYPQRFDPELTTLFGGDDTIINRAVNLFVTFLHETHGHRVTNYLHFWQPYFDSFNRVIVQYLRDQRLPIPPHAVDTAGFYDASVVEIDGPSGPSAMARVVVYNGHHKVNALKYGALTGPNGMLLDVSNGIEGRRHDQEVEGDLFQNLNYRFAAVQLGMGRQYKYYKDKGYNNTSHAFAAHHGINVTPMQTRENDIMKTARGMGVENFFRIVTNHWKLVTMNHRIGLSPVSIWYQVACILENTLTCLDDNSTGEFFLLHAPTLAEYFQQPACNL